MVAARLIPTSTHWGNYRLESREGRVVAVHGYEADRNPTPIAQSLLDAQDPACRVPAPMVRQGWLQARWNSEGAGRGREPFVRVDWETALDLAADALRHAIARGIGNGDIVRLFNDRGACLAAAVLYAGIRRGVIELPTGAWYDPEDPFREGSLEVHGNPNVLTRDAGTSRIAQGPTAHSCLVEAERFSEPLPDIKVFRQPEIVAGWSTRPFRS